MIKRIKAAYEAWKRRRRTAQMVKEIERTNKILWPEEK